MRRKALYLYESPHGRNFQYLQKSGVLKFFSEPRCPPQRCPRTIFDLQKCSSVGFTFMVILSFLDLIEVAMVAFLVKTFQYQFILTYNTLFIKESMMTTAAFMRLILFMNSCHMTFQMPF